MLFNRHRFTLLKCNAKKRVSSCFSSATTVICTVAMTSETWRDFVAMTALLGRNKMGESAYTQAIKARKLSTWSVFTGADEQNNTLHVVSYPHHLSIYNLVIVKRVKTMYNQCNICNAFIPCSKCNNTANTHQMKRQIVIRQHPGLTWVWILLNGWLTEAAAVVVTGLMKGTLFLLTASYALGRVQQTSMMWKHDFTLQKDRGTSS